ncbi:ribonuclease III [Plenodomus tracheiphilus IPT5]|uniref:Ribonuclease III n=1 Tax=Plenodomus tracheiphilus IPT5 TaxID=1408161 RepID=A0A6A7AVS6_9PLEO|nr:ribonuclease III [Plenodomus tracheiphilus IPT5]
MTRFDSFQDRVDYHFHNSALLDEAFLAAGATASRADIDGPKKGNKRLALVGDAALRLAVLDEWFDGGTDTADGHGQVMNVGTNERLAEVARKWKVKDCIIANPCQQGEAPRELLAATMEAIVGAVWVDSKGNLETVQKVFKTLNE